ncbi:hypothetical protein BgiMline_026455 [Biomphalaria glabrata]|nr:hypothetical protein BgiMline_020938 [Biomphalaria glabrata]
MLVRWTSQDTVLVALLLAILMTVHSSAKSKDRTDSQAVARHATKSPAALLDDIPGNSSSVSTPSPKHFAQAPSRKHRTKVHRNGDAMVALATAPTMVNGTSQTARTHHEPFRDGIYVEKNTKNRGSRKKWHALPAPDDKLSMLAREEVCTSCQASSTGPEDLENPDVCYKC